MTQEIAPAKYLITLKSINWRKSNLQIARELLYSLNLIQPTHRFLNPDMSLKFHRRNQSVTAFLGPIFCLLSTVILTLLPY